MQWNCRGFKANYDLRTQITEHNPAIICLQETALTKNREPSFSNYTGIHNDYTSVFINPIYYILKYYYKDQ